MTLQEQIFQASDNYEKSRWSHGVIDPVVLDEIGDAYFQGAEYGYKLAVDKACEWLIQTMVENNWVSGYTDIPMSSEDVKLFRKAMSDESK